MSVGFSSVSRFVLVAAAAIIMLAGMKVAADLLVPFLLAIFITVLCVGPLKWLRGLGLPNGIAITIVMASIVVVSIGLGTIFGASVSRFAGDIPQYQARLTEMADTLFIWLQNFGLDVDLVQLRELVRPEAIFPLAADVLASLGSMMTNILLILLTVSFMLAEEVSLDQKLKQALPEAEERVNGLFQITASINSYMAIKAAISFGTGFLAWLLCMVVGIEYAILWGIFAFLLNFVPTLGSLLAAVPPVLLALVQPELGPGEALATAIGYVCINLVMGNLVEPKVMGRGLGLSPIVVLMSLVFWGWILGPVGMLLSVPLTMMVKIALEVFPETRWFGAILGNGETIEVEKLSLPVMERKPDADFASEPDTK